jgi:hypothetical protein
VVAALVGAAALGAGECSQEGGLGGGQGAAQVQSVGQIGVALGGGADAHLAGQLAKLGHPLQATPQPGLVGTTPQVAHMALWRARWRGRANWRPWRMKPDSSSSAALTTWRARS